jgi:DNA polymerase-1
LIDQFIDAVRTFAISDLTPRDWSHIHYLWDEGDEQKALQLLTQIPLAGDVACDIESRNLTFKDNGLLTIGFAWTYEFTILITCFTPRVMEELQKVFDRTLVNWIWQNGKFDIGRLWHLKKLRARVDDDTEYMHYVGINERKGTHGLKEMGALFVQAPAWEDELDDIKKQTCKQMGITLEEFDYSFFSKDVLYKYAAFDPIVTLMLCHLFRKLMRPASQMIYKKLVEGANVYAKVECNGAYVDVNYMEDLEYELDKKIQAASAHFEDVIATYWDPMTYRQETGAKSAPKIFNLKSPAQLKWLLSKVLNQKISCTDKEMMEDLFEQYGDDYPVIGALRELRKYDKYMDTYVTGIRNVICSDGRVRCTYNLHGTETGRLSAKDPNMQNVPREKTIRNLFIAAPGKKFVQFDYSQAELRVLAYLSNDEVLKGIYRRGEDMHGAMAAKIFGPDFTKEQRVQAKTVNFGIPYGRQAPDIARSLKMSVRDGQKLIDNWFKQAPDAKKWIYAQRRMVDNSESPTTCLGRERHFILTSDNYNHVQNELVNFPIQSLASDMTMFSLIELQHWIEQHNYEDRVKIIITVHDSIDLEVDDDEALIKEVVIAGKGFMESMPQKYLPGLDFPFRADVEVGYKWGETDEYAA